LVLRLQIIYSDYQSSTITTVTRANFSVDGGSPVPFLHIPNLSTTALQYNSLVFLQTNLSNGDHRLDITTTGSTNIYVNFDTVFMREWQTAFTAVTV
ncbi:hypothetical protein K443DRAFT_113111, partial [Laccaria amethystina LaAM-08-1]